MDVGCGFGSTSHALAELGVTVYAFDPCSKRIEYAKKHNDHSLITYFNSTISDIDVGGFDFIVLFDVIEHIPDYKSVLQDSVRLLNPAGKLFVEYNPY